MQGDDCPVSRSQARQGLIQELAVGERARDVSRRGRIDRRQFDLDDPTLAASDQVETGVDEQSMDPGVEPVRITNTGQVAPRADHGLLDGIVRELAVAEDQARRRVQPRETRIEEHGKGVVIAPPRSFDELSLVHGRLARVSGTAMVVVLDRVWRPGPLNRSDDQGLASDPRTPTIADVDEPTTARSRVRGLIPPLLFDASDFRRLWAGQTISVIGDQVTIIGLPLVAVLTVGADAAQMGYLAAAGLLPHLLFSLPAGVWLDRVHRRRRLMMATDIARALVIATIPVAYVFDALTMAQLYVVGFVAGSLSVAFDLAWNTVFVSVVRRERYVEALALLNGSRSIAYVAGPTIGGALVQLLGAPLAMLADALSYLGSVLALRRIQAPEPPVERSTDRLRDQLSSGMSFILRDPIMRPTLLSVATINLFNFAFAALFILYATTELGISPGLLGLVLGAGAVGGLIGAVVASRIGRRIGLGPAYALGCVLFPASLILVPLAGPETPMPLILLLIAASEFGAGLGVMILDINVGAYMQARIPDRLRARAMGAFRFVNYGVRPVGALLGGAMGTAFGVRGALLVATIASLAGCLWLVGSRILSLRELPDAAA
jgi:MFS family permease